MVGTIDVRLFLIKIQKEKLSDKETKKRLERYLYDNRKKMSIQAIKLLEEKIAKY